MEFYFRGIVLLIILFASFIPLVVLAQECQPCPQNAICNPLKVCTFEDLINSIINFIFWVAVVIAPLMIIIAAFYFIFSAGDPGKVKTAKSIIFWTIIGFTIVLLAKGIISMIKGIIGG